MSTPSDAVLAEAYRQGAEWMRGKARQEAAKEMASAEAQSRESNGRRFDYWDARRDQAKVLEEWIAALPLPDGPPPADARVALLAQQVVDAVNDCHHCGGGGGSQSTCAGCKAMLGALKEAGIEVEPTGNETLWPYWRLKP